MSEKILKALQFATEAHGDQKRKYTGEAYISHPMAVAEILRLIGSSEDVICAGLLHDVVEDTSVSDWEILMKFGSEIFILVLHVTDIFTSEGFPEENRSWRKANECQRLQYVSNDAKTIKLADLIDNTSSIVKHDPRFAKIYLKEKEDMLKVLIGGNEILLEQAHKILEQSKLELKL